MTELGTAMMLGMLTGFFLGVTVAGWQRQAMRRYQDLDWRRSFNHENTNSPSGPPPLKFLRSRPTRELLFFGAPVRAADEQLQSLMTPEAQQLLNLFNTAQHGTAHGLAKVLAHVADNYGDSESWEAVPRDRLITLAKQLTADLPAPYGELS